MECNQVRKENANKKIEECCISCHEDDETGYGDDLWFDINGKKRNVCCAISRSFEKLELNSEHLR